MNRSVFYTIILISSLLYSCARNPVTGKRELSFISEKQEIAMGQQADPGIVQSFGLYEDPKLQAFINEKGAEMAAVSHRPHLDYDFKILDSPVVNAFALPGGFVYFTRGILAHFNNEAEFAGVLGHEIGHITAKHSVRQQNSQIFSQAIMIGGVVLSEDFRNYANVANQGLGLLLLKNSRDHESESDKLGVEYSTKIGYDSHNMANFFQTLKRLSGESSIPSFMSTHPDPVDRYAKVHNLTTDWQAKLNLTPEELVTNRNIYLKRIHGLIYGPDPKQGFVEGNSFYHPVLRFVFDYPQAWTLNNAPSQVTIAPQDGKALLLMTLAQAQDLSTAKSEVIEQNKLNVIETQSASVNGNNAIKLISEQSQAAQNGQAAEVIRILTYLIQYDSRIYVFHGMSKQADFNTYFGNFQNTMNSFKQLSDPKFLNREAEKIKIVTNDRAQSLKSILEKHKITSSRLEELAIINGMQLSDQVPQGMMIKVVE